ncbi:6818_t:CDS:1, partial [Dentiscutata erythropus]
SYVSSILPTMEEFLKEVDENEGTDYHYQDFLEKFKAQRVSVKNLMKLMIEDFKQCGVDIVEK